MKKLIRTTAAALALTGLVTVAAAAEPAVCTISADTVSAAEEQVTVPIRIANNPGFTNFGIALDYDRELLTLVRLDAAEGTELEGTAVAVNPAWEPAQDADAAEDPALLAEQTYGYVTCAAAEAVTGNDVLFTATFAVSENFSGTADVTPIVRYLRTNAEDPAVFSELAADAKAGSVEQEEAVLYGDVNGNGEVTTIDAVLAYAAANGKRNLTEAQFKAADVNGNGEVTTMDAVLIYAYANGKRSQFPVEKN